MARTPDPAWIEARLTGARPQVIAALLRYFRDLDLAEEAFQEACLRALKTWPEKGPPRDPAAWLVMVGRNAALDHVRRSRRLTTCERRGMVAFVIDASCFICRRWPVAFVSIDSAK